MFPIVLTTYLDLPDAEREQRQRALRTTIASHEAYLCRGDLHFIVVHDGRDLRLTEHGAWHTCEETTTGGHKGVGASLNVGFDIAFKYAPYALYVVDDWELTAEFDIDPWITLLEKNEDIGAVRLGPPHPDLTGMIKHYDGAWALRLDRHHFAFSHRPTLFHKRFLEAYGPMPEGVNAYEAERIYNEHFCAAKHGPDIVYALPYPWEHIETVELAGVEPTG